MKIKALIVKRRAPFLGGALDVDINRRQLDLILIMCLGLSVLRHNINDDAMVYGSVSRGAKAGAFNTSATIPNGADPRSLFVDDEFVTSYEIGAKTTWQDGRLGLNGAIFYMDYTDYQVLTNVANGTLPDGVQFFVTIFDNAGALTSKGAELEIVAAPTEGFELPVVLLISMLPLINTKAPPIRSLVLSMLVGTKIRFLQNGHLISLSIMSESFTVVVV